MHQGFQGNPNNGNQLLAHNHVRKLKRGRYLCQVSSAITLYVTFCFKERQLCDTSTGRAKCICAEGWKGSRCQDRVYEPPSIPPTNMPTISLLGSKCSKSIDCATDHSDCFEGQCQCNYGFTSRKGFCINVNECENGFPNECHRDAKCIDYEGSYECSCNDGFHDIDPGLPGRKCKQKNECRIGEHNCDEASQVCLDRRPPKKWECIEKTQAPTPKPTQMPIQAPWLEPTQPPTPGPTQPPTPEPTHPPTPQPTSAVIDPPKPLTQTVQCDKALNGVISIQEDQCLCIQNILTPTDLSQEVVIILGAGFCKVEEPKVYFVIKKDICTLPLTCA
jgi:Calcium-binding EGF domain/EB module